jgi:hypothetical protein
MTPVQGAGLVNYRNRVAPLQSKQQETAGIWFHFTVVITPVRTLAPPPALLYNPLLCLSRPTASDRAC